MGKNKKFVKKQIERGLLPKTFKRKQPTSDGQNDGPSCSNAQKKPYISAYKRAEMEYQKIKEQENIEAAQRKMEFERRSKAIEEYDQIKKKMNKALMYKTKKGQPKLDAQISVLLEKIERRVKK